MIEIEQYETLERWINAFHEGNFRFLSVIGPPGVGKTTTATKDCSGYKLLNGRVTPLSCYKNIHEATQKDHNVIIDDVDDFLKNDQLTSILLQITDTTENRVVQWNSTTSKLNGCPQRFKTESSVMFLANHKPDDEQLEALFDRGIAIKFDPSKKELLQKMIEIAKSKKMKGAPDVIKLIKRYWDVAPDVSLRTLNKGCEMYQAGVNWKEALVKHMGITEKREEKELVLKLLEEHDTKEQAAEEFMETTGRCRKTFFNRIED